MNVYFIQAGTRRGPVKIGYAENVHKRIAEIQVCCPFSLKILFILPAKSLKHAQDLEKWFHDRFSRKHVRGEWFKKISIRQIHANIPLALAGSDWDEIRAENGGSYKDRGKSRLLSRSEISNQQQVDKLAGHRKELNHKTQGVNQ